MNLDANRRKYVLIKDLKLKVDNHVKRFLQRVMFQISKKILMENKLLERFLRKNCKKQTKKNLGQKK